MSAHTARLRLVTCRARDTHPQLSAGEKAKAPGQHLIPTAGHQNRRNGAKARGKFQWVSNLLNTPPFQSIFKQLSLS